VWGEVQLPQELTVRGLPQLSLPETLPQFLPRRAQKAALLSGVHWQMLLALHVCGETQAPHELTVRGAPQLSVPETVPQFLPRREQKAASVSGVQAPTAVKRIQFTLKEFWLNSSFSSFVPAVRATLGT